MKRSSGVTVIAVLALLGSLLCFAMSCLTVLLLFAGHSHQPEGASPGLAKVDIGIAALFYIGPAIWGFLTAIGLFRLRRWARTSTLAFAGLLTTFGLLCAVLMAVIAIPTTRDAPFNVKFFAVPFFLAFSVIGIWWLIYFTRSSVKAQFETGYVPKPAAGRERPISVSIIGWLLVASALALPINLFLHVPVLMFGLILSGWIAGLTIILMTAIAVFAGTGLLRLRESARILTIAYVCFGVLNSIVSFLLPGSRERMAKLFSAMPHWFQPPAQPAVPNPVFICVCGIFSCLVIFYFLFKHKAAFKRFAPPPSFPDPLS